MKTELPLSLLVLAATAKAAGAQPIEVASDDVSTAGQRPPIAAVRPEAPKKPRITVDGGVDVVSEYISRGVAFSEKASVQPFLSVGIPLPNPAPGTLHGLRLVLGNWNSLQGGGPGLGQPNRGDLSGWYESDLYASLSADLGGGWHASFGYYHYLSPSHSFRSYDELEWVVSWDDTGRWDDLMPFDGFALNPRLRVTQELGRPGRSDALYIQPSITPSVTVGGPERPVTIGVPVVLGFSDDYYDAKAGGHPGFGYLRTGLSISVPLTGGGRSPLTLTGGVDVWLPNHKVASGLDGTTVVGRIGLRWGF
ncbi:MAG: hypothetical protein GC201_12950 [Alphaproteobacteria bacterium]|nr:hypothetical protein [Alphaproteobacteria bacterium]